MSNCAGEVALLCVVYVMYFADVESSDYLFPTCSFVASLWIWLGCLSRCSIDTTYVATLLSCIPINCSSHICDIFISIIIHILRDIWISMNGIKCNNSKSFIHATKTWIIDDVALTSNNSHGCCLRSNFDRRMLDTSHINPRNHCFKDIVPVCWQSPTSTSTKANTDGLVLGSHASTGGIFHGHTRPLLGSFASNLGDGTCFYSWLE